MTKLQLTLTNNEVAILKSYGSQFGYSLSKTVHFLISKATVRAIVGRTIPEFPMSEETEAKGLEALKEHGVGKTTKIDDVSVFFSKL